MMRKKASKKVIQSHVHQEEVEAVAVLSTPRTNQAKKVIPSHDLQEAAGISITILLFRFLYKIATIVLSISFFCTYAKFCMLITIALNSAEFPLHAKQFCICMQKM